MVAVCCYSLSDLHQIHNHTYTHMHSLILLSFMGIKLANLVFIGEGLYFLSYVRLKALFLIIHL